LLGGAAIVGCSAGGGALGVEAGNVHDQVHTHEQLHGWLYVHAVVVPSGRVQSQVQIHCPLCGWGDASVVSVAVDAGVVGSVHVHVHDGLDVGVAVGSVGA
jgi:hypothetical protein